MKNLFAFFIVLASMTSAHGQAQRFEIKRLFLGMTQAEVAELYPWVRCFPPPPISAPFYDVTCLGWNAPFDANFTLGLSKARIEGLQFRDGALVQAEVSTDDVGAREAARALLEKYGNVKPYLAQDMEPLPGKERCFVVRYAWGTGEKLLADINFPRCGQGGVTINKTVSRRAGKSDI